MDEFETRYPRSFTMEDLHAFRQEGKSAKAVFKTDEAFMRDGAER